MPRILLVEDDSDVQRIVLEFLEAIGHRVMSAGSAKEARLILASERIDLALVDCVMSGEQGNSLAEHALSLGVPTILTSGDPRFSETQGDRCFPFLPKPFRLTALEELISRMLQARPE